MDQTFYIDIDEEISSVIDRLRKSVATDNYFVVPKRALFVQSIINLKLLKREADNLRKKIILVTQDEFGINMAEKAGLEVKTSQEEVPQHVVGDAGNEELDHGNMIPVESQAIENPVDKVAGSLRLRAIGTDDFYGARQREDATKIAKSTTQKPSRVPVLQAVDSSLKTAFSPQSDLRSAAQSPLGKSTSERVAVSIGRPEISPNGPLSSSYERNQQVREPQRPTAFGGRLDLQKEKTIEKMFKAPQPSKVSPGDVPVGVGGTGRKIIMGFIAGCAISFVGVAAYVFIPSANVEIVLDTQKKIVSTQLTASASSSAGLDGSTVVVPLRVLEKQDSVSLSYDATGLADSSGKKAHGSVTIYNSFSTSPQTLIATTRISTSDGKIFRLLKAVVVPGMIGSGSNVKPGAITADVEADQPGDGYNINPTTFTIPGFQGSPKFDTFSAKSTQAMTGGVGSAGGPRAVSDKDISDAKAKAEAALKEKLMADVSADDQKGDIVLPQAENLTVSTSSALAKSGDVKDSFDYSASGTMTALVFSKDDVSKMIATLANKDLDMKKFNAAKIATPDYSNISADFGAKTLTANVDVQAVLVPLVDANAFKQNILGKDESQIKDIVGKMSGIKNINIDFSPPFISQVPKFAQRVTVSVNTGE